MLLLLICESSCELFLSNEEADKRCKENELSVFMDKIIVINYQILRGQNVLPSYGYEVLNASRLTFIGSVRKMDCHAEEADNMNINCSAQAGLLAIGKNQYTFTLLPELPANKFIFMFYNDLEYISVQVSMRAEFADGKVFESSEIYSNTNRLKYWTDYSGSSYTINLNATLTWKQVIP
jgi:hypothetical protein